jgi:hypothetical protein
LFHVQHFYEMQHQGAPLTVYRSNVHSFWHDNIQDEAVRDKLWRRVRRFENLAQDTDKRTLLFVRTLAGSAELDQTEALYDALKQKFERGGRQVCLLVIIDDQPLVGPILLSQHPNILVWVQPLFQGQLAMDKPAPFEEAIACAVRYFMGDLTQQPGLWPAVENVAAITEPGSPFRDAGLKDTGAGLIAGNVLLKGQTQEIMFAAFEGLDAATPSTPSVAITGPSAKKGPAPHATAPAAPSTTTYMAPHVAPAAVPYYHAVATGIPSSPISSVGSPVRASLQLPYQTVSSQPSSPMRFQTSAPVLPPFVAAF